jgi:phosphinothricin acetyltransferase
MVRPSTEADLPEIARIYRHYVANTTSTFEIDLPTDQEIAARRASALAKGLPHLVAERNGELIGYAYASPYRPRPAYRFTIEDSIYLDPRHTGRGHGKALLAALIKAAQQTPAQQMVAIVGDSANLASIQLHKSLGFRHVGTLTAVGNKFDRWIDTVILQLALQSA